MPKAKKAVEDVYQKKTQLEHVLLRPDTYIGSVERQSYSTWVHDGASMTFRDVSVVPGLYKIFDEILVNAADNKVRDATMSELRIEVQPEANRISVWNNGEGVPIEIHKKEQIYVPELIFGNLLTSSNFDDDEKKMTGGRNGFGAKLANIFSTQFVIETGDGVKEYRQIFTNNMNGKQDPEIQTARKKGSYTCVQFYPDLAKFSMTHLDDDIVAVMRKRAYDMAGLMGKSVKVSFNGQKIPIRTFEDYVDLYLGKKSEGRARVHLRASDRWEIVVACTEGEFCQMSFVNSICTMKGGTHVNYIVDQICKALVEKLNKKIKTTLKNFHVKNHLHVFINCMIENPAFDSQTKENMTTRVSDFGSRCALPDDFLDKVAKCGILDQLVNLAQLKSTQLLKKTDGSKTARISIPKLDDANLAGTRKSTDCTLILTEGDSAKALAMAGLGVVGRDTYGVFPLRGKLLNVRDASNTVITNNKEIQYLKQIIGLQHNTEYSDTKRLRYGHVMIMTDQDYDGSHIKGLILNFLHHCHPSLIQLSEFIQVFVTPIVRVSKGNQQLSFYTMPEYESWKETLGSRAKQWHVKYYKGLGTSTRQDAVDYFKALDFHKKQFVYEGTEADNAIDMAFSKKRVADRKEWLAGFEEGTYLDHNEKELSYTDFVNKELILFSWADIDRSIPHLMDGQKVTQRKIIYSCLKKGPGEMKVIQLVGYVSQHAAYHHGDTSLSSTIIGLAQNFVGSNNINLLEPSGQFGTRLQGGKDSASPRYLHTALGPLTRKIFHKDDDDLLEYLDDDGQSIQPKWYVPVIPMILVNGAEGIGTGWSTSIPNYNPIDIIENLRRMLEGNEPSMMHPWYMGYSGTIDASPTEGQPYSVTGKYVLNEEEGTIEIFDLALKKWTDDYKEFLKESMAPTNGDAEPLITDFVDGTTDTMIHFIIYVSPEQMQRLKEKRIPEALKLTSKLATSNMVLFNEQGGIQRYANVKEILISFYSVRMEYYIKRKASILTTAAHEMRILDNKARFIREIIAKRLILANRKKADVEGDMERMGFDKELPANKKAHQTGDTEETVSEIPDGANYDYLLGMPMYQMTLEKVQELEEKLRKQKEHVEEIQGTEPKDMWRTDLDILQAEYEVFLESCLKEMDVSGDRTTQPGRGRGGRRGGRAARGRGRGAQTSRPEANTSQAASSRGRGRNGRGRGRGRSAASGNPKPPNVPADNESLVNHFGQFQLASGSSAPSNANTSQAAPQPMTEILEDQEVTSPARPRPKRKDRTVVLMDTDSDEEIAEAPVDRTKRPRRQISHQNGNKEETDVVELPDGSEEEESVPSSDSDYAESGIDDGTESE